MIFSATKFPWIVVAKKLNVGLRSWSRCRACGVPWLRGYWQSLKIKKIKETIKYLNIINTFIEIMIQNLSPSCDEVKGLNRQQPSSNIFFNCQRIGVIKVLIKVFVQLYWSFVPSYMVSVLRYLRKMWKNQNFLPVLMDFLLQSSRCNVNTQGKLTQGP